METNAEQKREELRARALREAGVTYSLSAVFPIVLTLAVLSVVSFSYGDGYADTDWYRYLSYLLPQICFAAAAAIYFVRTKQPLRQTYRGCKWYYFAIAVVLEFGLMFSLSYLNNAFVWLLGKAGYIRQGTPLPDLSGWNLLPAILVIAVLPAVFEETVFRGILSRNMHEAGWGTAATVLIAGALFSLFHGSPEQTLYQFACGMCFTLVALRSGSVFPTVVAHFLNNALILVLTAVYSPVYGENWSIGDIMPVGGLIALCVTSGLCLAGSLAYLIFFDRKTNRKGGVKGGKLFFPAAAVGVTVCAVEWLAVLIEGFIGG